MVPPDPPPNPGFQRGPPHAPAGGARARRAQHVPPLPAQAPHPTQPEGAGPAGRGPAFAGLRAAGLAPPRRGLGGAGLRAVAAARQQGVPVRRAESRKGGGGRGLSEPRSRVCGGLRGEGRRGEARDGGPGAWLGALCRQEALAGSYVDDPIALRGNARFPGGRMAGM